jgi:SAM-dependent methyltransferase
LNRGGVEDKQHRDSSLDHPGESAYEPRSVLTELQYRLLLNLSRDPAAGDYAGGTLKVNASPDSALDFLRKTIPDFDRMIENRKVLDYGCGYGWQACAMKRAGAASVTGYDPFPKFTAPEGAGVRFTTLLPTEQYDVVVSCSSFEHFADPLKEIAAMKLLTNASGRVAISWAEPWFSHSGSHMNFFTRVPWVNILFSEEAVMRVRAHYRDDGAHRYEDGGLGGAVNRMTLRKWERLLASSGMTVEWSRYYATKGLPAVTRIPGIRELLTSSVAVVLRPSASGPEPLWKRDRRDGSGSREPAR